MTFFSRLKDMIGSANVKKPVPNDAKLVPIDLIGASNSPFVTKPIPVASAAVLPPVTHPDRFPACLKVILKHEGGYVNHPNDPGGRTNLGVTQRVWEDWTDMPATEGIMRALTPEKVAPLYRARYWDLTRCPDLPPGLDLCVFDFAVNAGPGRAIRYLQMMVGAKPDGKFGSGTMQALSNYIDRYGTARAIDRYAELRGEYYRQLKTFPTFGKGWLRRVAEVTAEAKGVKA